MDYYEEDFDGEIGEDPIEDEFEDIDSEEEDVDDGLIDDVNVKESKVPAKTTTVFSPPSPLSTDLPSGKDIAQVVGDLLNAKIFGDESPNQSLSKIAIETLDTSDRLRKEFEAKLQTIPLNKTEDYILHGQLYGDLASKALDANNQRIGTLNALAKFVPKSSPSSQVNVAQQMNNQQNNGVSPEQFMEVIKATEDAGLNPITRIRDMEEDAAEKMRDADEDEDGDGDGSMSSEISPDSPIVFSPSVDDFGA